MSEECVGRIKMETERRSRVNIRGRMNDGSKTKEFEVVGTWNVCVNIVSLNKHTSRKWALNRL